MSARCSLVLAEKSASAKACRRSIVSANGRESYARSTAHRGPWKSPPKVSTNCSRDIWFPSASRTRRPGAPATAGPRELPMWWKTMVRMIAVSEPRVMPEPRMISAQLGTALATPGCAVTNIARPRLVPTMMTLRWSWKSTRERVWMPTTATVANIASAAPPRTGCGMPATTAAALGNRPSRIMMTPAEPTTQRLFTLVRRTRPTFSAKHV